MPLSLRKKSGEAQGLKRYGVCGYNSPWSKVSVFRTLVKYSKCFLCVCYGNATARPWDECALGLGYLLDGNEFNTGLE